MQFIIDGKISIELLFNSEPSTPTFLNLFEYVENIQIGLPTALIKLNCRDEDLLFVQKSLYDGAPLQVTIKHNAIDFPYNLNLTLFGTPSISPSTATNEGYDLTLYALLGSPKYMSALTKTAYVGSISNVLTTLAKECSLIPQLINTGEDTQTWFSYGKTYMKLANYLMDHCYLNDTALPILGITHPNNLLLKNVTEILQKDPTHTLGYQTRVNYVNKDLTSENAAIAENAYLFLSYKTQNIAGLYNSLSSYGSTYIQQAVSSSYNYESSKVTFARKIPNSEVNKFLKSQLGEVAVHYLPIHTGNTYPKFYPAYAKNTRLRSLYSNLLQALTVNEYTKIRILDCVKVAIDLKFTTAKDDIYSGNYLVTGKTINITRNIFREKITLTNYGRNMANNNLL